MRFLNLNESTAFTFFSYLCTTVSRADARYLDSCPFASGISLTLYVVATGQDGRRTVVRPLASFLTHHAATQRRIDLEIDKSPPPSFTSHPEFPRPDAISAVCGDCRRDPAVMASSQRVGSRYAKVSTKNSTCLEELGQVQS